MNKSDNSFFRPLWRRIAITLLCAAWAVWEWINGDQFWIMMTLAVTAYAAWTFLIRFEANSEKAAAPNEDNQDNQPKKDD